MSAARIKIRAFRLVSAFETKKLVLNLMPLVEPAVDHRVSFENQSICSSILGGNTVIFSSWPMWADSVFLRVRCDISSRYRTCHSLLGRR
jgi:hypothetical protein